MSTFQKFEDIIAWQKARILCRVIKEYTDKELFSKDFKLVGQIKGSSGSVMVNIAEGFERGVNKEFIQFLYISNGSLGETRSQLYSAQIINILLKKNFKVHMIWLMKWGS